MIVEKMLVYFLTDRKYGRNFTCTNFEKSSELAKVKKEKGSTETPLMKQYNQIKARHPHALLLFRVGDFYETFGEDAVKASKILGIILTKRGAGSSSEIELAGFPHHSLDTYLPKLVRAGERVAICDQLEDPKLTKTIVKRGVTELVTPGVSFNDQVLEGGKNNFLCAIHFDQRVHGISFLDVSTGEFMVAQGDIDYLDKLIQGFEPKEIIFQKKHSKTFSDRWGERFFTFRLDDWVFNQDFADELLNKHFETASLKGFGVDELNQGIVAAGAVLHYLSENQQTKLSHISAIQRIEEEQYVWLDKFTIRNLELVSSLNEGVTTLVDILDRTQTPMGGRMMRRWVVLPLKNEQRITARHASVSALVSNDTCRGELTARLKAIGDLERLVSKVAVGKINPKEVQVLRRTLEQLGPIKEWTEALESTLMKQLSGQLDACVELQAHIQSQLEEDPAIQIGKGNIIRKGVDAELDELREISQGGKDFLEALQHRESERTGISSLKVAFNNVFGYYIEVRNTHKDKVPEEWIRKQTLVQAERYITEELKQYESKILTAEDRIHAIEARLYQELVFRIADYILPIQRNAKLIAQLDCLVSFAQVASDHGYHRPQMDQGFTIDIKKGRHPVIERRLKSGEVYVPNDVFLNNDDQQVMMITGPNMSGKSALLRQTAIICLMAQMGSFVPAESAAIGIVDKVFTRVGASDNISSGESTFMVEMNETASILNNLSDRSLVLLDEIGRGTSTYDGISIAWAIAEFIHEHPAFRAKTLFATHYHELNEMSAQFPRVKNFNVSIKETGSRILFTRKLQEGGSEHSFGIHVAKLAGMPSSVLRRAEVMLRELEMMHRQNGGDVRENVKSALKSDAMQLSFFQLNDPVLEQIHEELIAIDINALTPVEALMKLNDIKKIIGG
jgi:DNA mismatch repair protein MutS